MIALSPPPSPASRFESLIGMPASTGTGTSSTTTHSGPPSSSGSNSPRSHHRGLPSGQHGSSSPHRLPALLKPAQLQRLHAQAGSGTASAPSSSSASSSSSATAPFTYISPAGSSASLNHLPPPASPSATSPLLFSPPSSWNDSSSASTSSTFSPSATVGGRGKRTASPRSSPASAANLPNLGNANARPVFSFYNQPPSALFSGSSNFQISSPRAISPDGSVASSSAAAYTTSSMSQAFRPIGSSSSLVSSSSLAPSASINGGHSGYSSHASSRHSSRRPSLVTLQSFLEGVNHVTRVRSPSLRGHSRSGSLDDQNSLGGSGFLRKDSFSGDRPWHEDDIEEIPSWDDHQFLTPNSPTPRRPDFEGRSRNTSIHSLRPSGTDLFTPLPGAFTSTPVPIRASNALDFASPNADDDYDEYAERTFVDRREGAFFPDHIHQEDEERHLQNLDEESLWTEQDLNTLQEGDRIGIGLDLEGYPIVDALESSPESPLMPDDGIQYEIVRQLGYGSYAIVYLVKEVLYDHSEDEAPFPHDYESSSGRSQTTVYGREFALKCLSKRNLSEEQITVQKFEATLHKQLPKHENVVALQRAMETPVWLFLLLEYCPGQDLFFWLEQARDAEGIDGEPSRAPSRLSSRAPVPNSIVNRAWHHTALAAPSPPLGQSPHNLPFNDTEATPPSPSLLAATIDTALLSRRRLRLISRMFVQLCDGLQACHNAGVSHRDIKPENIIIVDNRAEQGSGGKVAIKITDWGLGTSDKRCDDFDCGSKPYMAYECRNNIMPSYEPKAADVWSLGIVLLNLLFHRCPWADPTLDDPDFSAFNRNPVTFLETRFQGIGSEVANFLANKVFTEVEDIPTTSPKERVTAGEFGRWAGKLVRYMGEGGRRGSISDSTVQLVPTVRQSPRLDDKRVFQSPPTRSPRHSFQLPKDDVEASPSRKAFRSSELPNDLIKELERVDKEQREGTGDVETSDLIKSLDEAVETLDLEDKDEGVVVEQDNETEAEKERKERHRRRKRGARKAKAPKPDSADAISPSGTESRSPNRSRSGSVAGVGGLAASPEISITEASQSVQALAREISQTTKPPLSSSNSYSTEGTVKSRPAKSRFADRFKGAFANGNTDLQAFQQRARDREMALTGGVDYNNPTASAPAKMQHVGFGTGGGSGISSFGSVASTGSWSEDGKAQSHWASTGSRRERVDKHKQHPHSTSGSRERIRAGDGTSSLGGQGDTRSGRAPHSSRHHQQRTSASQYAPSTVGSSPSRQSSTPLSSFSSSTSYESSRSPAGRAAGGPRSPLHSIEERVKDTPITSTNPVRISEQPTSQQITHRVIREPLPPPIEPVHPVRSQPVAQSDTTEASAQQQPPAAANAPKAKLGRLFKFTRG